MFMFQSICYFVAIILYYVVAISWLLWHVNLIDQCFVASFKPDSTDLYIDDYIALEMEIMGDKMYNMKNVMAQLPINIGNISVENWR